MTAASGIVHEEFHSGRFTREGGKFELVQLWVNLPAVAKKLSPRYQEIAAAKIPTARVDGAAIRVIAGKLRDTTGPAQTFSPIHLWDMQLTSSANVELPIPDGHTTAIVLRQGQVTVNGSQPVDAPGLVLFDRNGDRIALGSESPAAALLLAGQPLDEPVVGQGPFVMNTAEEIRQAFAEYQSGAMGHLM
jgi:hypothetical protein